MKGEKHVRIIWGDSFEIQRGERRGRESERERTSLYFLPRLGLK